jgi:hypothetical protein
MKIKFLKISGLYEKIATLKTNLLSRKIIRGSSLYWESRYRKGMTSGSGSFGRLSQFKARVINNFIVENHIQSIIEFGCGDGNQLALANYPSYYGLDVSGTAIDMCKQRFEADTTKKFAVYDPFCFTLEKDLKAESSISLDVIYHLTEDNIFEIYLKHLFDSASKYVIIYSSDHDEFKTTAAHVRHRHYSSYVNLKFKSWTIAKTIHNPYPFEEGNSDKTSKAFFNIYEKIIN